MSKASHTRYEELLSFRVDGEEWWLYGVTEYDIGAPTRVFDTPKDRNVGYFVARFGTDDPLTPNATNRSLALVSEDDLFWAVGAREADAETHDPNQPHDPLEAVPFKHAIYWSDPRSVRLRERNGARCLVYAVEDRSAGKGRRKPVRYGIRFPGDRSYWVVSAAEVMLAPTYESRQLQ